MPKYNVGIITAEQAAAIDPTFVAGIQNDATKWDYLVDTYEAKKGETYLVFETSPTKSYSDPKDFMIVKITKIDLMRESMRISNGEYTWNTSIFGVKL